MKHLRSFFSISMAFVLFTLVLSGCSKKDAAVTCPFSDLTWESSLDDMTRLEGTDYQTYDSVYNGTTYTYPKKYMDAEGTIKYMFDGDDNLMCIAWSYGANDNDTLDKLYNKIHKQVEDTYGESGYDSNNATNYGDVWDLDGGHIILSAMTTSEQKALQYSYQNPNGVKADAAAGAQDLSDAADN